jgi:hypothetical protein
VIVQDPLIEPIGPKPSGYALYFHRHHTPPLMMQIRIEMPNFQSFLFFCLDSACVCVMQFDCLSTNAMFQSSIFKRQKLCVSSLSRWCISSWDFVGSLSDFVKLCVFFIICWSWNPRTSGCQCFENYSATLLSSSSSAASCGFSWRFRMPIFGVKIWI